jgi:hypothetical protein
LSERIEEYVKGRLEWVSLSRWFVLISSALDQLCGFLPCYVGYVVKVFVVGDYVGDV